MTSPSAGGSLMVVAAVVENARTRGAPILDAKLFKRRTLVVVDKIDADADAAQLLIDADAVLLATTNTRIRFNAIRSFSRLNDWMFDWFSWFVFFCFVWQSNSSYVLFFFFFLFFFCFRSFDVKEKKQAIGKIYWLSNILTVLWWLFSCCLFFLFRYLLSDCSLKSRTSSYSSSSFQSDRSIVSFSSSLLLFVLFSPKSVLQGSEGLVLEILPLV